MKVTLTDELKFLVTILRQIKLNMIQIEQLKFLHYHLELDKYIPEKIQDINQKQLNKLNLNILYWVKVFNKGLEKEDKKEGL